MIGQTGLAEMIMNAPLDCQSSECGSYFPPSGRFDVLQGLEAIEQIFFSSFRQYFIGPSNSVQFQQILSISVLDRQFFSFFWIFSVFFMERNFFSSVPAVHWLVLFFAVFSNFFHFMYNQHFF